MQDQSLSPVIPSVQPHRLARRRDPATSHMAAKGVQTFAASHKQACLFALKTFGPQTVDQIADNAGLKTQQVNKRMKELHTDGLAEPTGQTALSDAKRSARVWRAK